MFRRLFSSETSPAFGLGRGQKLSRRRASSRRRLIVEQLETRLPLAAPTDLAAIEGRVFADTTGDGFTPGEEVAGATVNLFRDNGDGSFNAATDTLLRSATTGADGRYRFDNVPAGDYFVHQPAQTADGRQLAAANSPLLALTQTDVTGQLFTVIDSFDAAPQLVFDDTNDGVPVTSSVQGPTSQIIGGERDVLVNKTSEHGRVQISVNDPLLPGVLSFDSIQTGQGQRIVSWDGIDGDALTLNDAGLGNVDLTGNGAATGLRLEAGADQANGTATVRIYTDDGVPGTATRFSTGVIQIPDTGGLPTSMEFLPFSAFVATSGGGADFTRVGAIELEITGAPNVNGTANLVGAVGPTVREFDFSNFAVADLQLGMAVNDPSPGVGQNVTFTLTVTNDGPDAATGVAVQNTLPAELSFVGSTPSQGSFNASTGIWNVGSLAAGASATLAVIASVNSVGTFTNRGEISASDQFDPDTSPQSNQASVTISSELADLSLTKSVSNDNPNLGDQITFTVTVSNAGPSRATGIQVRDQLPAGLSLISSAPSQGSINGGIWTVGALADGATASLVTVARVETVGVKVNTAEIIAADQPDPNSTPGNNDPTEDDQDSVTVTVVAADLSLTKTVSNAAPNVGSEVVYTITVRNAGPSDATGVTVREQLPAGLQFVSATPPGVFDPATGIWTIGSIAVGSETTLQLTARPTVPGELRNTAEVQTSDQPDPNSTPGNNVPGENDQASLVIIAQQADLSLSKTVDDATPNLERPVVFTVTLANAGPSTATGIQVEDRLPAGLTLQNSTVSTGSFNPTTGIWSIPQLLAGSTATLRLTALVQTTEPVTNVAEVIAADQPDPNSTPGNNDPTEDDQDSVSIRVQSADLSLSNTVDNASPNVGDTVRFTVQVNNDGPDAATGVAAGIPLPQGLTFVASAPSQGTYTATTGRWNIGSIPAGGSAVLTLDARVDSGSPLSVTAQVIEADQFDPNSTPGNNVEEENDQQTVVIAARRVDLALGMTADRLRPVVGDNVTFTITLANAGPDEATGISVRDVLPETLGFVSSFAEVGSYSPETGLWTVPALASGEQAALQLVARYQAPLPVTNTAEIVAVDQFDTDPANNRASVRLEPATADLSLTKTVSDPTPMLGESVTFTVTVSNAGPDDASGVSVRSPIVPGLVFVNATPSAGTYSAATGVWTIGGIPAGDSRTLDLLVTPSIAAEIVSTAEVLTADQFDPDSTPGNNVPAEDDQDSAIVFAQLIDLSLAKSISNPRPNVGENVTFTLTLNNAGPSTATGVRVLDRLPDSVAFVSATATGGSFDPLSGIWTPGPIGAGGTAQLTLIARVTRPGTAVNTAEVIAADQPDATSTPGNNDPTENDFASVSFTTPIADLSLTKTVDNPTPDRDETITFTVVITNSGPDDATGIVVSNPIPQNFNFTGSSTTAGTFTPSAGTWVIPSLANGASATLRISGRPTSVRTIVSTAEIIRADQSDPDSVPGDGDPTQDDIASVIVIPKVIDLSVTGRVDNLRPLVGDEMTLIFNVANSGPSTATGVALRTDLPQGVSLLSFAASQGGYDPASGRWVVDTLAPGQIETLWLTVRVDTAGIKTATTQVVAANQFDRDSTPNNNIEEEDDQVTLVINAPRIHGLRSFLAR